MPYTMMDNPSGKQVAKVNRFMSRTDFDEFASPDDFEYPEDCDGLTPLVVTVEAEILIPVNSVPPAFAIQTVGASLCGVWVESEADAYVAEVAAELKDELLPQLDVLGVRH